MGLAELLADAAPDILAVTAFPVAHWQKLWSDNPQERLNREIRRRRACPRKGTWWAFPPTGCRRGAWWARCWPSKRRMGRSPPLPHHPQRRRQRGTAGAQYAGRSGLINIKRDDALLHLLTGHYPCLTARSQTWEGATTMKTAYRATIGRITARFNWDRSGVFLAALLFLGECMAVILAVISLASKGYDPGQSAALLGAAVLALNVPLAICLGKMPFAAPTEYEKRRTYAQAKLSVRIPRSGDKTKGGWALGVAQVHLEDSSDESIRAAVGRAYCLGDQDLQHFCSRPWIQDVKPKILLAQMQLVPPAMSISGISTPPGLMDWSQEDR